MGNLAWCKLQSSLYIHILQGDPKWNCLLSKKIMQFFMEFDFQSRTMATSTFTSFNKIFWRTNKGFRVKISMSKIQSTIWKSNAISCKLQFVENQDICNSSPPRSALVTSSSLVLMSWRIVERLSTSLFS